MADPVYSLLDLAFIDAIAILLMAAVYLMYRWAFPKIPEVCSCGLPFSPKEGPRSMWAHMARGCGEKVSE
jgi:hypothetical protein